MSQRLRVLAVAVAVAVASASAGWLGARLTASPADAARVVPEAAPILVPVEQRLLESALVVRGNARFTATVDIAVDPDLGVEPGDLLVVTGQLAEVGDDLNEGEVAVEVAGRPVILLEGDLPMYRALRPGMSGEDVRQLEEALARLGHLNRAAGATYDSRTAAAVERLYEAVGYGPVAPSREQEQQLTAARQAATAAEATLEQAEQSLLAAGDPPPRSVVLAAEGRVAAEQVAYDQAVAQYDRALADGEDETTIAAYEQEVAGAANRLAVAEAQLTELVEPGDTRAEARAVRNAEADLALATDTLSQLEATFGTRLPRGEVVFVPSLPRRVDELHVSLRDELTGPVMRLTGAELLVVAELFVPDAEMVTVGQQVRLDHEGSGVEFTGTVSEIPTGTGGSGDSLGSQQVVIVPDDDDLPPLSGMNLRVTIPVGSTDGEVFVVPLAALVTDAAGTASLRVAREERFDNVTVTTGLAADGFVEVVPDRGTLVAGELVVVGTQR